MLKLKNVLEIWKKSRTFVVGLEEGGFSTVRQQKC